MPDSFGHTTANAALFADFGFEAFLFTRINDETRDQLNKDKMNHFVWTPFSQNSGAKR